MIFGYKKQTSKLLLGAIRNYNQTAMIFRKQKMLKIVCIKSVGQPSNILLA